MNIHTLMLEKFDLARAYAEDGAFRSAARILGDLAKSVTAHADWCAASLDELMARVPEEECPGHVASIMDPKVCGRCGTHVDSLRPDDDDGPDPRRKGALEAAHHRDDPVNLQGSDPAPIEPREG
jgi:hypothetical protein